MLQTIYIVRHGARETWNLDYITGKYTPSAPTVTEIPTDVTLNATGITQSHELTAFFSSLPSSERPERIFTSPYFRCLQTITPTANCLELPISVEPGLAEWFRPACLFLDPPPEFPTPILHPSPGTADQLVSHFPRIDTGYFPVRSSPPPQAGEVKGELFARVGEVLSEFISRMDEDGVKVIVICTHAAVCLSGGRILMGERHVMVRTELASVSQYERMEDSGDWRMARNGDTEFLSEGGMGNWYFNDERHSVL